MRATSKLIISSQSTIHQNLEATVRKHLASDFKKPYADHNLAAFENAFTAIQQHNGPIIFDSFCGVGESTATLASAHPDALLIGIDKSLHRLNKHQQHYQSSSDNYLLVRADVDDFWRLATDNNIRLSHHYLLYPNPWPKPAQLKLRIHGSPLFKSLLSLGGHLELRSNWQIYCEEFQTSLELAGRTAQLSEFSPEKCMTPFERKFLDSGHPLWRCLSHSD